MNTTPGIVVLLIDDQPIIAEAVRRMLDTESDIAFHYCQDPTKALGLASKVHPTVILQDLVMPEVDGLMLLKFFRANPATRETPMIVLSSKEEPVIKAQSFALGASDYLVKLPDKVELIARIRHHSRGYISLLQRNEAYEAIAAGRKQLAEQIATAACYLRSLLPAPNRGRVKLDWRYIPSADLGGDTFGYDWLDADQLAIYILDVTGHGLDSALFAVTIMNVLRSRSLPNVDFHKPAEVLARLNDAFPMERYGLKNFTIWYGVYRAAEKKLSWAGGGHPDALLIDEHGEVRRLASQGPMMGMMPWSDWGTEEMEVTPGTRLYAFTDGVQEIHKAEGGDWTMGELIAFLRQPDDQETPLMDRLHRHVCELHGSELLDDDFSIVEACF